MTLGTHVRLHGPTLTAIVREGTEVMSLNPTPSTADLATLLVSTRADGILAERNHDPDSHAPSSGRVHSADAQRRSEFWRDLCESADGRLLDLTEELLHLHNRMAREWLRYLSHTLGLIDVLLSGDDSRARRAARDLVFVSHRVAFDPNDISAAQQVKSLLNMSALGDPDSQLVLAQALAWLGGEVAAARSLERDGLRFEFLYAYDPSTDSVSNFEDEADEESPF